MMGARLSCLVPTRQASSPTRRTDKVISAKIEGSTCPNFVGGPDQKRLITSLTADELKFINPAASAGEKAPTGLEASEVSV